MITPRPRLAVTPGEPAGIGPDLCLALAMETLPAELIVLSDPELLRTRAQQLGLSVHIKLYEPDTPAASHRPGELTVLPVPLAKQVDCGHPDVANAKHILRTLDRAAEGCMKGEFQALVTGPVNKAVINAAGIRFSGHTEYLAERSNARHVVMMLATPGLRVALVTTHLPLAAVSHAITPERLTHTLRVIQQELRHHFHIAQPRMLILGLNPHAGEQGHLGTEEIDIIEPVLAALRQEGMTLTGPVSADTAFTPELLESHDVVVAMYHDQGLPVLKHMGFGRAVNVSLGLPFIRTSVDHGTALELAGSGQAETGSFRLAIDTALEMEMQAG